MITPGQALWIINNLPQNPPSSSIMPSVWQNSRRQVVEELQAIVDAEQSVHLTAFGAGWRGRLGKLLVSLGSRIAQSGGK